MSGGQQGGPMGGGGKGGTQQMPSGGGKGGPQGHMMPNGQRQVRPGMGGPMGGPGQAQHISQKQPGQGFHQYLQSFSSPQPQTYPGFAGGGLPPQQMGTPGQQPAQFQHQMAAMNNGTPGPQYQPQQQPRQLSGLLAKLYGG